MDKILLAPLADLPEGGAAGFDIELGGESTPVLALRSGGEVRVFHNVCPHAGRRLEVAPGRFIIDADTVVCAAHGACFTIPDGSCVAGPCRGQSLRELSCELRGYEVWIDSNG